MRHFIFYMLLFCSSAWALTPSEKEVVIQMRDTISGLRTRLTDAQNSNDSALKALSASTLQVAELIEQTKKAAHEAARIASERDALADEISVAKVNYDKLNIRYQRAQLVIAIFTAIFVGLIVLQFTHNLQPPYGFLVPILAGTAAFFAVYWVL